MSDESGSRITRELIVRAALEVIDDGGIEACTMRAVAARVHVEAMSLYWYVPTKDDMLDGVVALILDEVREHSFSEEADWREGAIEFATVFRQVLLAHPNAVPLLSQRAVTAYAAAGPMASAGVAVYEASGFDRETAILITRAITRWILGFTLIQVGVAEALGGVQESNDQAVQALLDSIARSDPEKLFQFGLQAMIDGFATRLSDQDAGSAHPDHSPDSDSDSVI